jgi:hypothetical protein
MQSMVTVPLYDTLGEQAVEFILSEADVQAVLCHANNVAKVLAQLPKALRLIVKIGDPAASELQQAALAGVTLCSLKDLAAAGLRAPCPAVPPQPSDLATVCYTSGTTGQPKGAMLTHANIVANLAAVLRTFQVPAPDSVKGGQETRNVDLPPFLLFFLSFSFGLKGTFDVGPSDVHISYLPLAHMFERVVQVRAISLFDKNIKIKNQKSKIKIKKRKTTTLQFNALPSMIGQVAAFIKLFSIFFPSLLRRRLCFRSVPASGFSAGMSRFCWKTFKHCGSSEKAFISSIDHLPFVPASLTRGFAL